MVVQAFEESAAQRQAMAVPRLLRVEDMPTVEGIRTPKDLYWVLQNPAPLAGMTYPSWKVPWQRLYDLGFRHVVCLTHDQPEYDPGPLLIAFSARLEDLIGQRQPHDPPGEARRVAEAASVVLERLKAEQGVIVHCAGGTGRTGTVIGVVLRQLGLPATDTVRYLNRLHRIRGQDGWPESPWQADLVSDL